MGFAGGRGLAAIMTAFEQHRPAMGIFFASCAVMALIFGSVVLYGGTPVRPEVYGPVVFAIPALAWASTQFILAAMAVAGCVFRFPRMASIGALGIAFLFEFFAVAAIFAGASGTLLVSMAIPAGAIAAVSSMICWRGKDDR
jgi:hypothetical protein